MSNKLDLQQYNPSNNRTSTAPYNFVPLPEKVIYWDNNWNNNNVYDSKSLSGEIEVSAENLTPFYIRGQIKKSGTGWDTRDNRLRKEPYTDSNGFPCIPGSSFRGMIRNIFEIITYSRITPVSSNKLFYRTLSNDSIGITYRNNFVRYELGGGYFYRNPDGSARIVPCIVYKVKHSEIKDQISDFDYKCNPNYTPEWNFRNKEITIIRKDESITGKLVLTGSIPKKNHELLFVEDKNQKEIKIPEFLIDRFEDDDQITKWQGDAFPKNKPNEISRFKDGMLANGDAIGYLKHESFVSEDNPDGIFFFGRAKMFRLPYDLSPEDLTTNNKKSENKIDFAQKIFGTVANNKKGISIKSRVSFSDFKTDRPITTNTIVPKLLSSPRPTTFQHYLVQKTDKTEELRTYLENNRTFIRGHKLYWHRWDNNGLNNVKDEKQAINDKTHTIINVIPEKNVFKGKIRFYNLSEFELGALLASLQLPDNCAHKIGMGKPLGLGSIKLKVDKLSVFDFTKRYSSWKNKGIEIHETKKYVDLFTKNWVNILIIRNNKVDKNNKKMNIYYINNNKEGLAKLFRIEVLYNLLRWEGRPDIRETQYQSLNEFKERKVLPTPHKVLGLNEPFRVEEILLDKVDDLTKTNSKKEEKRTIEEPVEKKVYDKLRQNFDEEGYFKLVDGKWIARFEPRDERDGVILNEKQIPSVIVDGTKAIFRIREMKKSTGLRVVFVDLKKGK